MLGISLVLAGSAKARTTKSTAQQIHVQQKRYYHSVGYLRAIGHAARHTIYSPNPRTRTKWQRAVKYLIQVRDNSQHAIYLLKHPQPVYDLNYWINREIQVAELIAHSSRTDPWPNCPDPVFNGAKSWQDTVDCENGGNWYDSPGYFRCGLQFDPMWERKYGRLCP